MTIYKYYLTYFLVRQFNTIGVGPTVHVPGGPLLPPPPVTACTPLNGKAVTAGTAMSGEPVPNPQHEVSLTAKLRKERKKVGLFSFSQILFGNRYQIFFHGTMYHHTTIIFCTKSTFWLLTLHPLLHLFHFSLLSVSVISISVVSFPDSLSPYFYILRRKNTEQEMRRDKGRILSLSLSIYLSIFISVSVPASVSPWRSLLFHKVAVRKDTVQELRKEEGGKTEEPKGASIRRAVNLNLKKILLQI